MEVYTYKGISSGKYVEGEVEALNQDEASHKLKEQKIIKNPLDYQKEDLIYNENLLGAVKTMLKHYTEHSKWPEELKDE